MAITIDVAAAALKRYPIEYAKQFATLMRQEIEWEDPKIAKARTALDSYVAPVANVGEVLQPYQCPWTPKGTADFKQVETRLQRIKWDFEITCDDMEVLFGSWLAEWYEMDKDPKLWSFPRFLYENVILPKLREEQNWNYYNGVYAAPTPGTAGASIASMDGLKTKIASWITGSALTPIPTGAITETNVVDAIEDFVASLPAHLKMKGGPILVSNTIANWYYRDYRAKFGTGNGILGNDNMDLKIDNSNKYVKGMASMEGSNRIIFAPDLIWLRRTAEAYMPAPVIIPDVRKIKMYIVYHRAIGTENFLNMFVNDQA